VSVFEWHVGVVWQPIFVRDEADVRFLEVAACGVDNRLGRHLVNRQGIQDHTNQTVAVIDRFASWPTTIAPTMPNATTCYSYTNMETARTGRVMVDGKSVAWSDVESDAACCTDGGKLHRC
jgi:hypothetical protein